MRGSFPTSSQVSDFQLEVCSVISIPRSHVGAVHILRHSGAIARLQATGNPKAVQDQLGRKEAKTTLRYLNTLGSLESSRNQQRVGLQC